MREATDVIRGPQRSSQWHSEAVRRNQRKSEAIKDQQRSSEVHQRSSTVLKRPSEVHQRSIRGHQRSSEAIVVLAELVLDLGGVGVQGGRVPGAGGADLDGQWLAGDFLDDLDDLEHLRLR
jgi:hypothetical protein